VPYVRCMRGRIAVVAALGLLAGSISTPAADAAPGLSIEVLSNRADLISGGDALVRVDVPKPVEPSGIRVEVGGRDVTAAFHVQDGNLVGLVEGLAVGENRLTARPRHGAGAALTITNHPTGGPLFAGPQVQPWLCGTELVGLGPATDAQCDAPSKFLFFYKDIQTGTFTSYDPAAPPPASAIASTTTDQGVTVPFIVRLERGTADRGIYEIAVLFTPGAAIPQAWNHKLVVPFGGGTAPHHSQDPALPLLDDPLPTVDNGVLLGRGFLLATSGLNVEGFNANVVTSAEAVLMNKEHIVERYGPIRYTIGVGCSGGSIQQQVIAAEYPGLLDGIQPSCSFPDLVTTGDEVTDCHLLLHYFTATSPALWPDPAQQALVDGHHDVTDCQAFDAGLARANDPTRAANCNLPADQVYDPATNPAGVRCTVADYQIALWGPRRQDGFAKLAAGNLGVQYGLNALNSGQISVAQFLDLNSKIGGTTVDWTFQPRRSLPDPGATRTAYRAGLATDARQLADVPIIDLRAYHETSEIHTSFHSYQMRAKLDAANGGHGNQIIWTFPPVRSVLPPPDIALASFFMMDRWLAGIEADHSHKPLSAKVIAHKPADAVDACWIGGTQTTDTARCAATFPPFADARIAAGGPLTDDVLQCQLKRPARADYRVAFTDAQWSALLAAFPVGVCDSSRPSIAASSAIPWTTFAGGPGGRPLGAPPVSHPAL
jgi:hypothetical protein